MKNVLLIIVVSILTGLIGFFVAKNIYQQKIIIPKYNISTLRGGQMGLINPLFEYEIPESLYGTDLATFDESIQNLTNKMISDGKATTISVYFRSLNNGPWFGIDENTNFFPASLLKVPIMIAYYKKAETDPTILDKKIAYDQSVLDKFGDGNLGENYPPKEQIKLGQSYTVEELIEKMIIDSDNNAKNLLLFNLGTPDDYYKVYTDLGFATPPELAGGGDVLSVHEYASFYRVLYNASYLDQKYSEKALELLSKTDFNTGISGPVPDNVTISHKFGEYSNGDIRQLHDCGIVYYTKNPYILCVLTRGTDFKSLENVIETVSGEVYKNVDSQTKK